MRCSGCDHLKPHGPDRLTEPVVVGENRGGIDSHRCFEVQRIESPQVWHGQQSRAAVNRPIKSGQPNPVENPSHGTLIDALSDCDATQLNFDQITGNQQVRVPAPSRSTTCTPSGLKRRHTTTGAESIN